MVRRQQKEPPPGPSALTADHAEDRVGSTSTARSKSGARPSSGGAGFVTYDKQHDASLVGRGGPATAAGALYAGGVGTEEAERAFWELVFCCHTPLHPLLGDLRVGSAARARQLARVHCAQLFNDLVYAGLNPQEGVVGFHRTHALQAFLEDLVAAHRAQQGVQQLSPLTPEAVEAFVQQVRPDFGCYLKPPGACLFVPGRPSVCPAACLDRLPTYPTHTPSHHPTAPMVADAEYLLLGAGGAAKGVDLRANVCGDCFVSHLTGGLPIHVPAVMGHADIQALYARIGELFPHAKPGDIALRVRFRDRAEAEAEVIVGGQWLAAEGRYGWSCVPMTHGTSVDAVLFDPNERVIPPLLADMGLLLPTTEVVMCTRGCLHCKSVVAACKDPPFCLRARPVVASIQALRSPCLHADRPHLSMPYPNAPSSALPTTQPSLRDGLRGRERRLHDGAHGPP